MLVHALKMIERFGKISGFAINMGKTNGFFYNKRGFVTESSLPNIKWVKDMEILEIQFGSSEWQNDQWENKFIELKKEVGFLKTKSPTLDAKAMLSKFKLCSIFSYLGHAIPMPKILESKINDIMVSFIVPHKHTHTSLIEFSLPRKYGGYGWVGNK